MSSSNSQGDLDNKTSYAEREKTVLKFHSEQLKYYKDRGTRNRLQYYTSHSAMLILSGAIPILIYTNVPNLLRAVPAAIVGILAGMNSFFRFRENWIKNSNAAHALSVELVKYKAGTPPDYSANLESQAGLDNFMVRIEAIAEAALNEWRTLVSMAADPSDLQSTPKRSR